MKARTKKYSFIFILIFNLLITPIVSKKFVREDTVLIMTADNINKLIKKYPNLLVEITANFCGEFCKGFSADVTKVSIQLSKLKPRVNVARANINDSNLPDFLVSSVTRYPQLKYFNNGVLEEYTGTNSIRGMIKWCIKKVTPPLTELFTLAEIYNFKNSHDVSVIYFGEDQSVLTYMKELGSTDPRNFYAFANFETAIKTFNVKKNTVVLYKERGEERNELSGKISKEGLSKFVNRFCFKKLMELNEDSVKLCWEDKNPVIVFYIDKFSKNYSVYERVFRLAAEKIYGKIKAVISGIYQKEEKELISVSFVDVKDLPAVRIIDTSVRGRPTYALDKTLITNVDAIVNFVNDWEAGKLHRLLRSEPIPEEEDEYEIAKVVADNFKKKVLGCKRNFLLWLCDQRRDCERVGQKFDMVNKLINLRKEWKDKLKLGKIDMSKNDLEDAKREYVYPLIRLYVNKEDGTKDLREWGKVVFDYKTIINFVNQELNLMLPIDEEDAYTVKSEL